MAIYIGGGKKFGFDQPFQFYEKLEWEYEQVMTAGFATGKEISFHFMNFVITAWHLADWTYPHLDEKFLKGIPSNGKHPSKSDFARWTKAKCRPLAACHMIANASKHFEIEKDSEPRIEVLAMPGWNEIHNQTPMRNMMAIIIDGNIYGLDEFAQEVLSFWQSLLMSQELLPD